MLYPAMSELLKHVDSRYLLVNVVAHRARQLSGYLMEEADIVVAMREDYARVIRESYPEFADKVVSLGEINMPLFSGDEAMEQCYDAIKAGITELLLSEKD